MLEVVFERSKSYQNFLDCYCQQLDHKVLELNYFMMALLNGRFRIIKFLLDEDELTNPSMAISLPPIFNQSCNVVLLPLALVLIMAMDTRDVGYFEVIKELWSR